MILYKYTINIQECLNIIVTYIVMKRKTSKFILAATTANPNKINTKLSATYPGFVDKA